ncbi:hypothetical protein PLICRDRAFT_43776 [Plicaturopsis crispa FD-325 SS-3]|nr:hypothetical protein PLICRDRAFT_43776 [Plicaturopsis crispa FD-325 SS-3]
MHRCLNISEILTMICTELLVCEHSLKLVHCNHDRDVAWFARTCRAFRDPALDALWHTQASLGPLVRTFPVDLWEQRYAEDENGDGIFELFLLREIRPRDWLRPLGYAKRIRVLDLAADTRWLYGHHMVGDVMTALHACAPSLPLLPNLRELSLDSKDTEGVVPHVARMLLHPALSRVLVRIDEADPVRMSIIMALPETCPALDALRIESHESGHPILSATVSRIVGTWSRLTRLSVPRLPREAMATVAALPALSGLELSSLTLEDVENVPSPSFPALRTVDISGPTTIRNCTAFLSLLACGHPLRSISLYLQEKQPAPMQWREFFKSVAEHCSPATLTSVCIDDDTSDTGPPYLRGSLIQDIIRPMFAFPHITTFALTFPVGMVVDNFVLQAIAKAWPRLEHLDLHPQVAPDDRPCPNRVSTGGLASLVSTCRNLRTLAVTFAASTIQGPRMPALPSGQPWNTNLRSLQVGQSLVADAPGTAAFLSALCPNLEELWADDKRPGTTDEARKANRERWKEVHKLIPYFYATRAQERRAAESAGTKK